MKKTTDNVNENAAEREPEAGELADLTSEWMAEYAKDIILNRAIPDMRDGLKPAQRRALWTAHVEKLTPSAKHMKLATLAGRIMAYHPHGSSSGVVVNMSQEWDVEVPLVDIHGNNGGIDGSPAAADRYIEARLAPGADLLLDSIGRDAVPMVKNYDGTRDEPTLLPAKAPMVLVNGTSGMAIALATSILPHNPVELLDAAVIVAREPGVTAPRLVRTVPGPDFPTGGALVNPGDAALDEMRDGRASYVLRGRCEIDRSDAAEPCLHITEMPWGVTSTKLVESIASALPNAKTLGVTDVRIDDDSSVETLSIRVIFKRSVSDDDMLKVRSHLYARSELQRRVSCSNVMIDEGKPVTYGVKRVLERFNAFRLETLKRVWAYDAAQLRREIERIEGQLVAAKNIDEIVEIAKKSKDRSDMESRLVKKYKVTEQQASDIAGTPLYRLNSLPDLVKKLESDRKTAQTELDGVEKLLTDEAAALDALVADLKATADSLRDSYARRTEVLSDEADVEAIDVKVDEGDLIEDKKAHVVVDSRQFAFRIGEKAFANQSAAGNLASSAVYNGSCSTRDFAVAVADNGQCVVQRVDDLDGANLDSSLEPASKSLVKLNPAASFVGGCIVGDVADRSEKLVIVTKRGYGKAVSGDALKGLARRVRRAKPFVGAVSGLKGGTDEIVWAGPVTEDESIDMVVRLELERKGKHVTQDVDLAWLWKHSDSTGSSGRRCCNTHDGADRVVSVAVVERG